MMSERPDLDAIDARCSAATEGPWCYDPIWKQGGYIVGLACDDAGNLLEGEVQDVDDYGDEIVVVANKMIAESETASDLCNAHFIAASRTDLPAVVAYARELEARLGLKAECPHANTGQVESPMSDPSRGRSYPDEIRCADCGKFMGLVQEEQL